MGILSNKRKFPSLSDKFGLITNEGLKKEIVKIKKTTKKLGSKVAPKKK